MRDGDFFSERIVTIDENRSERSRLDFLEQKGLVNAEDNEQKEYQMENEFAFEK